MVDIKAPPVTKSSVGIFSQIFATIFVVVAAGLVAFSFSADHWLEVTVKDFPVMKSLASQGANAVIQQTLTSDLTDDPMFTSYSRGLFETCYNILNETKWPFTPEYQGLMSGIMGGNSCVPELGYEINPRPESGSFGNYYQLRIQLLRCHFAFMCAAMFCLVVSALTNAVGCCCMRIRLLMTASVLAFGGTFFTAGAMTFWHATMYVEYTKIDSEGFFYFYTSRPIIYQLFLDSMSVTYGYCYVLAWVAVGTSVVGAILYLVAAVKITGAMKDADEREWEREQEARGIPPVKKEDPKVKARKEKEEKERQAREKKEKEEEEKREKEEKDRQAKAKAEAEVAAAAAAAHQQQLAAYYSGYYPGYGAELANYNYAAYPNNPYMYGVGGAIPPILVPVTTETVTVEEVEDEDEDEDGDADDDDDLEEDDE